MIKNIFLCVIVILSSLIMSASQLFACTDFMIKANDNTIINARSMEFAKPMKSFIVAHPRGETVRSSAPNGQNGMSWTSKYGYIVITSWDDQGVNDGMNEKGLSFGFLWYPPTKYQSVTKEQYSQTVEILDMGAWLLGNFATVDEVKKSLDSIFVWGAKNPLLGGIPPIHIALHDATGKNLVIEFNDGVMNVHENPVGVLTNAPSFDWQITNLKNYVNLTVIDVPPVKINGYTLSSTGHGSGLIGLPGDPTPPSRFVRTVLNSHLALPATDKIDAINLAEHLLNAVDIVKGIDRLSKHVNSGDYTQWAVIKDLTNKVIYYRSYNDLSLKALYLDKIDFKQGSISTSIPISSNTKSPIDDVTAKMK